MRGSRLLVGIAVAVPLIVIALAVLAWVDAGRRPVQDITVDVPVPELTR